MKRFIISCFILIIASLNNGIMADSIPENIDTTNFNGKPKKKFTISVFTGLLGEYGMFPGNESFENEYRAYQSLLDPFSVETVYNLSYKKHLGIRIGINYVTKFGGSFMDSTIYLDSSLVPAKRIIMPNKIFKPAVSIPFDIIYIYGRKHCISTSIGTLYSSGWLWDEDINSSQQSTQYGTRNYLKSLFLTGGLYYYNNKRKHFYMKTGIIFYYRVVEFNREELGTKGVSAMGDGKTSPSYADRFLKETQSFLSPKFHIGYKF
jgi:hypothetical protein